MATRITEGQLRGIVRQEMKKMSAARRLREGAGAGEWNYVDSEPYIIARNGVDPGLSRRWAKFAQALFDLQNDFETELMDTEEGDMRSVKDQIEHLMSVASEY